MVWAIVAAMCIATTLYGVVVPFLPLQAQTLGLDGVGIGALFAIYGVASLVATVGLGAWGHRANPRLMFVGSLLVLVASTVLFAFGEQTLWLLFIARSLQGAAAAAIWVMGPSMVAARYPPATRGAAMGIVTGASAVGTLLGPPLGGVLYNLGGWGLPFVVVATGGLLLVWPCAWALSGVERPKIADKDPESIWALLSDPAVRRVCGVVAAAVAILALLEPLTPLWLDVRFQTDAMTNGLVLGAVVLAYALFTTPAGAWSDRAGRFFVTAVGFAVMGLGLTLVSVAPSLVMTVVALAVVGTGLALALTPSNPAFADALDARRGDGVIADSTAYVRGFVLYSFVYGGGLLIGPALGGGLIDLIGLGPTLFCAGVFALLTAGLVRWGGA
ncbi:MAG: DHA1 family solute carrier family 18 vesicular amine transporter 1/2 [Kiritimatiellia bacterium]|jgi:DHA1 family solute carrier family 18 vesicular amine transporter 1/2